VQTCALPISSGQQRVGLCGRACRGALRAAATEGAKGVPGQSCGLVAAAGSCRCPIDVDVSSVSCSLKLHQCESAITFARNYVSQKGRSICQPSAWSEAGRLHCALQPTQYATTDETRRIAGRDGHTISEGGVQSSADRRGRDAGPGSRDAQG